MIYPLDKNGCVINEAEAEKVQNEYRPAINEVLDISKIKLTKNFRSFCVRGSVSVGKAAPRISDLDVVVIVYKPISPEGRTWFSDQARKLERKYAFITFIDITIISLDQLLSSEEYANLKIYLKTQSYCIEGENILRYLPEVKPGPELALRMYGGLREELDDLRSVISGVNTGRTYLGEKKSIEFWCVWIMRLLLRSGLGLIMMIEPVYSQDLRTCLEVFSRKYSGFSDYMKRAFNYSAKPISDRLELLEFLDDFTPKFLLLWDSSIKKYEQKI